MFFICIRSIYVIINVRVSIAYRLVPDQFPAKRKSAFLFQPYGSGEVWSSVARESFSQTENYPSYGASMQYLACWDESKKRGVYYGLHDPAPASKLIHVSRAEGENTVTLKISQPLEGISKGCNSQRLYGENVWQIFDGDWFDVLDKVAHGRLAEAELVWSEDPAVSVVLASGGYPGSYQKGFEISGLAEAAATGAVVFHAGTAFKDGKIVNAGGRVLGVSARGKTIAEAIEKAYQAVDKISFEGGFCRRDIGAKALKYNK